MILQNEFRVFVRTELDRQHISQAELARRMGVARSLITKYLNGERSPGMDVVEKFYRALGFTPSLTSVPAKKKALERAS